jgi:hypothetical protein
MKEMHAGQNKSGFTDGADDRRLALVLAPSAKAISSARAMEMGR